MSKNVNEKWGQREKSKVARGWVSLHSECQQLYAIDSPCANLPDLDLDILGLEERES